MRLFPMLLKGPAQGGKRTVYGSRHDPETHGNSRRRISQQVRGERTGSIQIAGIEASIIGDADRAIRAENRSSHMQLLAIAVGQNGYRAVATASKPFQEGAFGQNFFMAGRMVNPGQNFACSLVRGTAFNPDGRLRWGGQPYFRIKPCANIILTQPLQPGCCQKCRIGLACFQLSHARCDIPANADDGQIGACMQQLSRTARCTGADTGAVRNISDRSRTQQHICFIRTGQDCADRDFSRADCFHILHRVDSRVDFSLRQPNVEFAGPQCLAANIGQRAILNLVAAGHYGNQFHCRFITPQHSA